MNIELSRRVESKVYPGVFFTLATWLEYHRLLYYEMAESCLDAYRDMQSERETITDAICERLGKPLSEINDKEATAKERGELHKLNRKILLYEERVLDIFYLKIGLGDVDGLSLG